MRPKDNPISDETMALIKEKGRLRRQYSQNKDPAVKTRINPLKKQVKAELKVESLVIWENSATQLVKRPNPTGFSAKLRTSLSQRVSAIIQLCALQTKSQRPTLKSATLC